LPQTPPATPDAGYRAPIHFPEEQEMPEGYAPRTAGVSVSLAPLRVGRRVGSDQFVYWLANEPARKLAPDVFVRVGTPQTSFGSWKTWEQGGAADLAVEIICPNEGDGTAWDDKLTRYHELGVKELVRFDPEAAEGQRLRVWDRVSEDLVERQVSGDHAPCLTLGLVWTVCPVEEQPAGLCLVDPADRLLEVPEEAQARARSDAEARVRELEAELALGSGSK
jgi:hypothetical protein